MQLSIEQTVSYNGSYAPKIHNFNSVMVYCYLILF